MRVGLVSKRTILLGGATITNCFPFVRNITSSHFAEVPEIVPLHKTFCTTYKAVIVLTTRIQKSVPFDGSGENV